MASSLQGPLAAYLGVRNENEAFDFQRLGVLARLQQQQQQAQLASQLRRDALAQQLEMNKEAIRSRESLAAQADARQRETQAMIESGRQERAKESEAGRMERAREAEAGRMERARDRDALLRALQAQKPVVPDPFSRTLQAQSAKDYAQISQDASKMGDQIDLTKKAIGQFSDYTQGQILGTGPLATLGGLTKYVSSGTEQLEATFRSINLKNMVATFQGMTRAIDTDTERRAWEATQPGITLDDPTNAQILVGGLSLAAKTKAEGEARQRYIETSPKKTLEGYVSPIIGKSSVLFTPQGDPVVIPKDKVDAGRSQGLITDKEFEQQILGRKRQSNVDRLLEKYK